MSTTQGNRLPAHMKGVGGAPAGQPLIGNFFKPVVTPVKAKANMFAVESVASAVAATTSFVFGAAASLLKSAFSAPPAAAPDSAAADAAPAAAAPPAAAAGASKDTVLEDPEEVTVTVQKARAESYNTATPAQKAMAASRALDVGDSKAAAELGFARNSVATWRKALVEANQQSDYLLTRDEMVAVFEDKRKNNNTEKRAALNDMMIALFLSLRTDVRVSFPFELAPTFFFKKQQKHVSVSRAAMRIHAKALWVKLNPDRADEFECSDNFLRNFFKAHAIVTRRVTTSAPKLAEDPEKMRAIFLCRIAFIAQKKNVAPSVIFYADESGVFLMPNKATTLDFKGVKNVPVAFSRALFIYFILFNLGKIMQRTSVRSRR